MFHVKQFCQQELDEYCRITNRKEIAMNFGINKTSESLFFLRAFTVIPAEASGQTFHSLGMGEKTAFEKCNKTDFLAGMKGECLQLTPAKDCRHYWVTMSQSLG
ncbi:hypothetical protein BRIN106911_20765 [Brevibacillus invocatus]